MCLHVYVCVYVGLGVGVRVFVFMCVGLCTCVFCVCLSLYIGACVYMYIHNLWVNMKSMYLFEEVNLDRKKPPPRGGRFLSINLEDGKVRTYE